MPPLFDTFWAGLSGPITLRLGGPIRVLNDRRIYVCYDDENNIQFFPLPTHASIHPPKDYFSEKAEILSGQLIVTYENGNGKIKRISYGKI